MSPVPVRLDATAKKLDYTLSPRDTPEAMENALGALRGVADTKVPMLINLFGFWFLGIPAGYLLAFRGDLGPEGLWWGLTVGLGSVAICLTARVWVKLRGTPSARLRPRTSISRISFCG